MNLRRALDLGTQIADALADAHSHVIVHANLDSSTIVVTPRGTAKILDFGVSTWMVDGRPCDNVQETGVYMSPERLRGDAVDHRTDIYSLGAVLVEMLTGTPPSAAGTPPLPPGTDEVIARALMKNPDDRYDAAAVLAADLRTIAGALEDSRSAGERG